MKTPLGRRRGELVLYKRWNGKRRETKWQRWKRLPWNRRKAKIIAKLQNISDWLCRNSTLTEADFKFKYQKSTATYKKWCRYRLKSAFSMGSSSYHSPDNHVNDACTTQRERNHSGCRWRKRFFRRCEMVQPVHVLQSELFRNYTLNVSLRLDLRINCYGYSPLTSTTWKHKTFVILMKDRYAKVPAVLSASKKTTTHVSNVLLDHQIVLYSNPDHLGTNNGLQLLVSFLHYYASSSDWKNRKQPRTILEQMGNSESGT